MSTTGSPSGRRRRGTASEEVESGASASASATPPRGGRPSKGPGAAKKAVTKKPAPKKAAAKKAAPKKAAAKKAAAKKRMAKKPAAKRSGGKKAATKKAVTKKPAAKRSGSKKAPAGKTAAKRSAKKRSAKHTPTTITRRVSRKRPARRSNEAKPLIGWREWVVLPEFTATPIKAKVDSGAVTSSLHAFNLQISTDGGQTMARFGVAPKQGSHAAKTIVEHPIVGFKKVRSSNGQTELRPVIRTVAVIGEESFEIDITLASRDAMGFRMLLGRRAVRNRFVIDPGRSFLQPAAADGDPPADQ